MKLERPRKIRKSTSHRQRPVPAAARHAGRKFAVNTPAHATHGCLLSAPTHDPLPAMRQSRE